MKPNNKTSPVLSILYLEDSPQDFEIVSEYLLAADFKASMDLAEDKEGFVSALRSKKYDIILADFNLPGFDGFGALKVALEITPETPFICISGSIGEETATELIRQGAVDYVLKDHPDRLPLVLKRALAESREKQALQKVELQLKLLSRSVEQSPVSIIITNSSGKTEYVNPKFSEVTGFTFEEVKDKTLHILKSGKHSVSYYKKMWETILRGEIYVGEMMNKKKNGEIFWERTFISAVLDAFGKITHFVAIMQDITENKKLWDELVKAKERAEESDRLKTAFLANVSHEIRTPMNGILGFMGLLKEPDLDDENKNQYIDIVNFSGRRLLNTVNDIVEISKIEAGQVRVEYSEVDVHETMEYLYNFFNNAASDKNLKLEMKNRLQNGKMIIKTDKKKLEGILINLLNNAIKFTEKGTVGFEVVAEDDQLLFSVYDTGIGIPKKQQKTVFDRFVQADLSYSKPYEGTGLGLSISKAYVEMLNGEIWLDSTFGKGSTFYFTIPYKPLNKKSLKEEAEGETIPSKKTSRIILVAEDDEVSITFLNHLLKKAGFQLLATTNGEDAVRTCREHPEISLILMDIKMPRMNGIEATRQIREFNKKVPIIAQTAYAMEGDSEKFLKAGCNAYISKPVAVQSLLTKINEFIDS